MKVSIEQLPSGNWRIRKMLHGWRFAKTLPYKPTPEEAERIIADKIEKDPHTRWMNIKRKKTMFVYVIENAENGKIKIGVSSDVDRRIRDLKTASGADLILLGTVKHTTIEDGFQHERDLHNQFRDKRIFVGGTRTEWFSHDIKDPVLDLIGGAYDK